MIAIRISTKIGLLLLALLKCHTNSSTISRVTSRIRTTIIPLHRNGKNSCIRITIHHQRMLLASHTAHHSKNFIKICRRLVELSRSQTNQQMQNYNLLHGGIITRHRSVYFSETISEYRRQTGNLRDNVHRSTSVYW